MINPAWSGMPSRSSGYGGYGSYQRPTYGGGRSAQAGQGGSRTDRDPRPQPSYGGFVRAMSGAGGGATGSARTRQPLASSPVGAGALGGGGSLPAFQKGDTVRHKAFGQGMVLSVQKMGGDALLEIAFDQVGTKRLMLKSAAAHMEKL